MTITSPCTGICKLDEVTGWCVGCGRSGDEIATWGTLPNTARETVWEQLPDRLSALGVTCRRLPWTTEDIRAFVLQSLENRGGTWVMGVVGGVAEFCAAPDASVSLDAQGEAITAHTQNGALRMLINDDIRALTFDPPGLATAPRIVLAVKRERGRLPDRATVTALGPDTGALITEGASVHFDLGLGRKEVRFGVRVGPGQSHDALTSATGLPFAEALPQIAGALVAESPTRVVETALGRIEVQGQIPPPDAKSPNGPHTHLLPDHLATERALPVGMDLPRAYLPGAIFYPAR